MRLNSSRCIGFSHMILGVCLLFCIILIPNYLFSLDQGGVSNYGTNDKTSLLFSIGFGFAGVGSIVASRLIKDTVPRYKTWKRGLILLGITYLLVLISTFPYKQNDSYESIHLASAFSLGLVMLGIIIWLGYFAPKDKSIKIAFMVYGAGFAISILTLFNLVHLLFTVQILSGASFGYILTKSLALTTDQ